MLKKISFLGVYFVLFVSFFVKIIGVENKDVWHIVVFIGAILCMPHIVAFYRYKSNLSSKLAVTTLIFTLVFAAQVIASITGFDISYSFSGYLSFIVIMIVTSVIISYNQLEFQMLMKFLTINFLAVLLLILLSMKLGFLPEPYLNAHGRFEAFDIGPGVWSAFAVGLFCLSVLSKNTVIFFISTIVAFYLSVITEMRSGIFTILIGSFIYVFSFFYIKFRVRAVVVGMLLLFFAIYFFDLLELIKNLLMWDDSNRGVNSGFTGRISSWTVGIESFLDSPLIGSGGGDYYANKVYNTYIRIFSKYGVIIGILFLFFIFYSLFKAIKRKNLELISVIIAYLLFSVVVSRDINIEIMPFVGMIAVSRSLFYPSNYMTYRSQIKSKAHGQLS
jgi:O-antigen ligase